MTYYRASPCPCSNTRCRDWHVEPVAAVQSVSFRQSHAKLAALMLNSLDGDVPPEEFVAEFLKEHARQRENG